jgi:hypothetical protein
MGRAVDVGRESRFPSVPLRARVGRLSLHAEHFGGAHVRMIMGRFQIFRGQ